LIVFFKAYLDIKYKTKEFKSFQRKHHHVSAPCFLILTPPRFQNVQYGQNMPAKIPTRHAKTHLTKEDAVEIAKPDHLSSADESAALRQS